MKLISIIFFFLLIGIKISFAQEVEKLHDINELQEYVSIAIKNNLELKAIYKQYESQQENIKIYTTLNDPQLSMGVFASPIETRVGPQIARFSITQMMPWFRTNKVKKELELYKVEAKYQQYLLKKLFIEYQVAKAFFPLYKLNQWKKIELKNIKLLEVYKKLAINKIESGMNKMLDVLRVELLLKKANTDLELLDNDMKSQHNQFHLVIGVQEPIPLNIPDTLKISNQNRTQNISTDSLLLNNHPKIKFWKYEEKNALAQQRIVSKQNKPNIGIGVDYTIIAKRENMTFDDNGKDAIVPKITFSIPIHTKKNRAKKKKAMLKYESVQLSEKYAKQELITNYKNIINEIENNLKRLELHKTQQKTLNQALKLLLTSYSTSGENFEEILRLQQELLSHKKKIVVANVQYHINLAKRKYILGSNINQKL